MEIEDVNYGKVKKLVQKDEKYLVPPYQRRYKWGDKHVNDFWNDINRINYNNTTSSHFIGTIVYIGANRSAGSVKKYFISDGQQRITTIFILLCAIKDYFEDHDNDDLKGAKEFIKEKLYLKDTDNKITEPRLELGNLDRDSFHNLLKSDIEGIENEKIKNAYNILREKLDELDGAQEVKKIRDKLLERVKYVGITVEDDNDAYQLFESLNNRGLDLNPVDLIKNFLFMVATKSSDVDKSNVVTLWSEIIQNLDKVSITRFFRQYLMSSELFQENNDKVVNYNIAGKVTESKLYEPLFKDIINEAEIEELLIDLKDKSRLYSTLRSCKANMFSKRKNVQINRNLEDINILSKTPYTLFLRLFTEVDDYNIIMKFFEVIKALLVRRSIAGLSTSPLNDIFHHLSQNCFLEKNNPVDYLIDYLREDDRLPSDDNFKRQFLSYNFKNNNRTNYYLRTLEEYYSSGGHKVNTNRYEVHIEHILPRYRGKNLKKYWLDKFDISIDEFKRYKNKIGNLTLLEEDPNISASNRTFEKKKEYYTQDETDFRLTHYLLNYEVWNIEKIKERGEKLADLAVDIWKVE